ncbi:hypothetical protein NQZ68_001131 [Dissostichus eleginoides]|nr:hypothetical protein NQZ68_001131 [Dissostichus eleginoides]
MQSNLHEKPDHDPSSSASSSRAVESQGHVCHCHCCQAGPAPTQETPMGGNMLLTEEPHWPRPEAPASQGRLGQEIPNKHVIANEQ